MSDFEIDITTTPDFAPSPRLRDALEALIAAYDGEVADQQDEVSGFSASKLQIGSLSNTTKPQADSWKWNNGCWGFDDSGCYWYKADDHIECLWHYF